MTTKPWIKLIHVKYIIKFVNYLLSKNNTIVLEMNLLMRWIHEAVGVSEDGYH